MWGPMAGLPPRLTLSGLAAPGRLCGPGAAAALRKDVRPGRGASSCPQSGPEMAKPLKCRFDPKRYITCPTLSQTLATLMRQPRHPAKLVLECNPGPGVLTRALLGNDLPVIALESDRAFVPLLESLKKKEGRNIPVVHCDFFKLDPRNGGIVRPPIMLSRSLFKRLGIEPVPWTEDIPLRVIGMLPMQNEKKVLWKLLHDLYSCMSVFKYGRLELNVFISEQECQKLVAKPTDARFYQPLSVLWQVACDIKVLHVEPLSSFELCNRSGVLEKCRHPESLKQEQRMCFIRMTPREDLFSESLTPINYDIFVHMVKQCFVKRNAKLEDHLPSLSPVHAVDIMKHINICGKSKIKDMYPQDFRQLFDAVECSKDYTRKWLYDDFMEEVIL